MDQITITNLCIFFGICFFAYLVFRNLNMYSSNTIEGMTTDTSSTDASGNSSQTNGIAGNAAGYAAQLKSLVIKSQDQLLISKYRSDYENAVLNLDDYLNNMMLQTALSINQANPSMSIAKLAQMQQAKLALNSTMKFIDSSK